MSRPDLVEPTGLLGFLQEHQFTVTLVWWSVEHWCFLYYVTFFLRLRERRRWVSGGRKGNWRPSVREIERSKKTAWRDKKRAMRLLGARLKRQKGETEGIRAPRGRINGAQGVTVERWRINFNTEAGIGSELGFSFLFSWFLCVLMII